LFFFFDDNDEEKKNDVNRIFSEVAFFFVTRSHIFVSVVRLGKN